MIKRISSDIDIPDLRGKLVSIFAEETLLLTLREGTSKIVTDDAVEMFQKRVAKQRQVGYCC